MKETKKLTRDALIGTILFCAFISFSNILYLEVITLMIVSIALVFEIKDTLISSFVFGVLLIIYMGLTPWSIMYVIIYPLYSLLTYSLKKLLLNNNWLIIIYGFILSAATGMLLDLPFILVNSTITIIYIISGLKVSLIQGVLTAIEFTILFEPLHNILMKVKEG